ncbi:MAG: hypothetical protein Q9M92_00515 [Enterobacterales bacterium]|nr:hypothetical protein [Enterobacterales bacterium]
MNIKGPALKKIIPYVLLLFTTNWIVSCSMAPNLANKSNQQASRQLQQQRMKLQSENYQRQQNGQQINGRLFVGKPFSISQRVNLPNLLTDKGFVYTTKTRLTISGHLNNLSNDNQISFYILNDGLKELAKRNERQINSVKTTSDSASVVLQASAIGVGLGPLFSVPRFEGSLAQLLDQITARVGLFWQWRNGRIEVFRNQRKSFIINTSAQKFSQDNSISSNGSGGATGAGVNNQSFQGMKSSRQFDNWGELMSQIKSTLSESGIISDNPSIGSVTVIDTPVSLSKIEYLIDEFNRSLEKRVIIEMHIVEITNIASSDYGVDWEAVIKNLGEEITLNTRGVFTTGNSFVTHTITNPDRRLNSSKLLVQALAKQGNTSNLRYLSANIQNGVPYPFQDIIETHYIASTKNVSTQQSSSTEIITDVVTDGITIFVRPQIASDGRILLSLSYASGSILSLEKVQSENVSITTPRRRLTSAFASSILKDGQTMLLTGFRQTSANTQKSGTIHPDAWLLGGSREDEMTKSELAILIKATLLD